MDGCGAKLLSTPAVMSDSSPFNSYGDKPEALAVSLTYVAEGYTSAAAVDNNPVG